jgi:inosose dehydratase
VTHEDAHNHAAAELVLATGPVSWGVDFADAPGNPPWARVLDDTARSGLGALELGPIGYLPEDPEALRDALASRELRAVGSFVFDDLHDPAARDSILESARRACRAIAAAGGRVLVIIDRPGPERAGTAGRGDVARRASVKEWNGILAMVEEIAAIASEHGLVPAVHPHAGGFIEFEDEIERFLGDSSLGLCLDTGHSAYAGLDAADALRRYGRRLVHLHLKDIDSQALARVQREQLDFWQAVAAGVFCPLGDGVVNLRAVADALTAVGYHGFATIEQDRVPGSGSPLQDLRECLAALQAAGIGANATVSDTPTE